MRERATREERILLVEDEEPIRDLVTTALRFTGFTVETAANGPEGLALARNGAWHVLVLDVNLPALDGFSLCRKLREAGDEVPVIFLTARDDPADLREGFTGGGDDYLTKGQPGRARPARRGDAPPRARAYQRADPRGGRRHRARRRCPSRLARGSGDRALADRVPPAALPVTRHRIHRS